MNNRKDFVQWLTKIKGISSKEQKNLMWKMDSLNRDRKVFEIDDAGMIKAYGEHDLNLYIEFLSQNEDATTIVEPKRVFEIKKPTENKPTVEISVSQEQVDILENDYDKKKQSAKRIHNNIFGRLSEVIGDSENVGLKQYSLMKKDEKPVFEDSLYVFDIVNGRFSDLNNHFSNIEMETYVKYETKFYPRKDNAFYYGKKMDRQIGCMNAFEKNPLQRESNILTKSIESQLKTAINSKNFCLVPDSLGDFKDNIKTELKSFGKSLVQIPRSIATIYSMIEFKNIDKDCCYRVYDFDCEYPCRTDIRIQYDIDAEEYVVIRMGRRILPSKTFGSYSQFVQLYIKHYCKKHVVNIPENIVTNMVFTKDILRIWSNQKSIIFEIDNGFEELKYDKEIIDIVKNEIITKVLADVGSDDFFVLFNTCNTDDCFVNLISLEKGCQNILSRINNKKIIWKEYLPKLDLEVIRDGRFDTLKLINDEHIQNITATSMDEEVDIPVENGTFIFSPNRDKILCPLTREEFGNSTRDKMAMFYNPKVLPLSEATEVRISLKYKYGDPDSYRLIATPKDSSFTEIVSEWCDDADNKMGNDKIPEYLPQLNTTKTVNISKEIYDFYDNLDKHWLFSKTGVKGNAPFDKNDNWYVLTPIIYNITSIQNIFSQNNIDSVSDEEQSKLEYTVKKLIDLYFDADNDCLYDGQSNFEKKHNNMIKRNIVNILSMLGGVITCKGRFDYMTICKMVEIIYDYDELIYIIQLSTYISRKNDKFEVWNRIDDMLAIANGENMRHAIRTIGAVCWRCPTWIYEFNDCDNSIIQSVIDTAIAVCASEIPRIGYDYNPRKIRDMLEALLGITRLKAKNAFVCELLNCNTKRIKNVVQMLKELDSAMYQHEKYLKYPFVSRLGMEVPPVLHNVSSVVYPLIEIFTDGNAIKLTGFTED